ncbi:HAD-IA family hydrolase [Carnobacterium inhibens]|uniref:HAD-IA family hydrolase n=1 Tax=Carnobacterium inhibens TaxID=147709 RepID=A0ABR7TC30_9LACT|nr:HAD-IA family hydrolase [Carnobacterium inhibens]MBC9825512.1 HAD-IA family hydrolase [Carnobacterium inhibens]
MFKHVIWDFDGTLFDTYPVMAKIFKDLLEKESIEEPIDEIVKKMQVSMAFTLNYYKKKYNISSDFINEYQIQRKIKELTLAKPFAEIEDICNYIHSTNRKNYLYTHRGESSVTLLKSHGLYGYFSDFITLEHGFERKPIPDALNYLIDKHSIHRDEAIMIGDRELDQLAAKNAGISACYFNENSEENDNSDYIIDDFKQLYAIL